MKTIEEMLIELPHLNSKKEVIDYDGFTATLYASGRYWHCDFVHIDDGNDVLMAFNAATPYEAVQEAYNYCKQHNLLKPYEND